VIGLLTCSAAQQILAGRREYRLAADPIEQSHIELALERADLP
jgi:hypothetical protein